MAAIFGSHFAEAVRQLPVGTWQGPIESGLGWHLVLVTSATPGRVPAFDEIVAEIQAAWMEDQRSEARRRAFDVMKARYEVRLPALSRAHNETSAPARYCDAMNARSRPVRAFEAMLSLVVLVLLVLLADALHANAHEARPAYLALTETAPDRFDVVWRTPVVSGMRLPVVLQLPDGATNVTKPSVHELSDSVVERRLIAVPGGLGGKRMEFVGLQGTITDVLVRVETRDGAHSTTLVHPSQPWIAIPTARGAIAVAGAYFMHGVEHILLGYDHLLFVFALILIVRNVRKLVTTVTAFTLAHSITLGLSALGVVHVPGPPVEASIALSILLLACETTRQRRGERSLTAQWPWLVAFAFGLLHGFGFASALADIGLPQGDVPPALFAFNVGIEAGQLGFIAAVLTLRGLVRRLPIPAHWSALMRPAATFVIGTMAAFWFVERLFSFWPGV